MLGLTLFTCAALFISVLCLAFGIGCIRDRSYFLAALMIVLGLLCGLVALVSMVLLITGGIAWTIL